MENHGKKQEKDVKLEKYVLLHQFVLIINVDQQNQNVHKLEKKIVIHQEEYVVGHYSMENVKKKRCCIAKINCVGNKCLKRLTQCKWGGALRCKNFTYNCKLQTRKK